MSLYYIYVIYIVYTIWKFIASQGIEMPLFVDICILICRYYIVTFDITQFQCAAVSYYRCSCIDRAYSKVARREIKISVLKMCFPQRKDEFMHVLTWITHNCQDPKLETKPNRVMHGLRAYHRRATPCHPKTVGDKFYSPTILRWTILQGMFETSTSI